MGELARRQIDGHPQETQPGILPRLVLPACFPHHPFADRNDQAGFLGQADEHRWREEPSLGVLPADERLDLGRIPVAEVDDRLVVEHELVPRERRG